MRWISSELPNCSNPVSPIRHLFFGNRGPDEYHWWREGLNASDDGNSNWRNLLTHAYNLYYSSWTAGQRNDFQVATLAAYWASDTDRHDEASLDAAVGTAVEIAVNRLTNRGVDALAFGGVYTLDPFVVEVNYDPIEDFLTGPTNSLLTGVPGEEDGALEALDEAKEEAAEKIYEQLFKDCDFGMMKYTILDSLEDSFNEKGRIDLSRLVNVKSVSNVDGAIIATPSVEVLNSFYRSLSSVFMGGGSVGLNLFAHFLGAGRKLNVEFVSNMSAASNADSHTIYLNVNTGSFQSEVIDEYNRNNDLPAADPRITIVHELGHVLFDLSDFKANNYSDEWAVINYVENPMRTAFGYGDMLRDNYSGVTLSQIESGFRAENGAYSHKDVVQYFKKRAEGALDKCK